MSIKAHIINMKRVLGMLDPIKVAQAQLAESQLDYMKSEDTRAWQECVSGYHLGRIKRREEFLAKAAEKAMNHIISENNLRG